MQKAAEKPGSASSVECGGKNAPVPFDKADDSSRLGRTHFKRSESILYVCRTGRRSPNDIASYKQLSGA
jgi:hypothetical protein